MSSRLLGASLTLALLVPLALGAQDAPRLAPATDLDAFMEKVLARRDVNRRMLNDYVLDEAETFEILGPGRMRLHRTRRDFTWYVRDGMHVRSPVRFDGVEVGTGARDEYERRWIARELERRKRREEREKGKHGEREKDQHGEGEKGRRSEADRSVSIGPGGAQVDLGGGAVPTEPRFVSEAYFMDFKFEPGNYLLAGRETFEGHPVLRIEYYPTKLFGDDDKKTPREMRRESRQKPGERELEDDIERRMNKTALVTLWVDPANHQIVKYTFDNVWLDFLPGAWLVRVDEMRASMTMSQPFAGVWLPRDIDIKAAVLLANGTFEAGYERAFSNYKEADVRTTIRIPKGGGGAEVLMDAGDEALEPAAAQAAPATPPAPAAPQEVVREIRVHGNAFLSDQEVLTIAGLSLNAPLGAADLEAAGARLRHSGRFETVDVRKRYRSLTDPSDVAIVLVVHERPGIRSVEDSTNPIVRPWQRFRTGLMFLPIVNFADGYGFTYGARVSALNTLGLGERLSVPLTWGGMRRAALEFERTFARGPLTRVTSSAAIWQRENPRYELDDRRLELKAGAERQFAQVVRLGVDASRSRVTFGGTVKESLWTFGSSAALDTRGDPAFPRNAVYAGAGWTGLHVEGRPRIDRYTVDTRGYLGLVGQAVLAGRALYQTSDAPLPIYERLLLGGASTLRGFRTGAFDGDRLLATSAELRVPLTSVISGAKLGVTAFVDAAKVADHGAQLADAPWRRGAGGGVFLLAPLFKLNLDVARGFDGGTRVHFGTGFAF